MILTIASAIHGSDNNEWYKTKWLVFGLAAILYGFLAYLATASAWSALVTTALVPLIVLQFRGGRQAQAELKCMGGQASPKDVLRAHYWINPLPALSLYFCNYKTQIGMKLGWEDLWVKTGYVRPNVKAVIYHITDKNGHLQPRVRNKPFWDCRRPTELASLFLFDIILITLIFGGL